MVSVVAHTDEVYWLVGSMERMLRRLRTVGRLS